MIKYTTFCLGKGKLKNCYKGWCITFLCFKIERIGMGKNFLWRFEINCWRDK
jgi:hypothetical protein